MVDLGRTAVVVDTDVWSLLFMRKPGHDAPHVAAWREAIRGLAVTVSLQTRAEVQFGGLRAGWGEARRAELMTRLDSFPVLPLSVGVADTLAKLRADCSAQGHALADKVHTGDAWIAASAIHYGLPLAARDGIYRGVPRLALVDIDR